MSPNLSLRISHLRHVKLSTSNKTAICTGCSRHTRCGLHVYTGCAATRPTTSTKSKLPHWVWPPPRPPTDSSTCSASAPRPASRLPTSSQTARPWRWRRGFSACPETLSPHPSLGRSPRACRPSTPPSARGHQSVSSFFAQAQRLVR